MKKSLILFTFISFANIVFSQSMDHGLRVINDSSIYLKRIYIKEVGETDWGRERINSNILWYTIDLSPGLYDIKVGMDYYSPVVHMGKNDTENIILNVLVRSDYIALVSVYNSSLEVLYIKRDLNGI